MDYLTSNLIALAIPDVRTNFYPLLSIAGEHVMKDMFGKSNIYWKVKKSWNIAQLNQSDSISHVSI